jgi:hypothetical protein
MRNFAIILKTHLVNGKGEYVGSDRDASLIIDIIGKFYVIHQKDSTPIETEDDLEIKNLFWFINKDCILRFHE